MGSSVNHTTPGANGCPDAPLTPQASGAGECPGEGMAAKTAGDQSRPADQELLVWRVHPAARNPFKTLGVSVAILCLSLGSAWYAGNMLGVLALLLLVGSLWPFFLPTRYRLTTWGIEQHRWPTRIRKPWSYFRRYQRDRRGVLLSPFPHPSRLDPFRGMYLLVGPGAGDFEQILRTYLAGNGEHD